MAERQQWLTRLKDELRNSPLVSNVAFGFILMGLEKLVELEFQCPCDPRFNGVFSSAFFIVPAVLASTLMLIAQRCTSCKGRHTDILSACYPATVWLILLFLDGQYFACAMTDWEGRFVLLDKAAPQKWCEPTSGVDGPQLMLRSQKHRFYSVAFGGSLLILICFGLMIYLCYRCCTEPQNATTTEPAVMEELEDLSGSPTCDLSNPEHLE